MAAFIEEICSGGKALQDCQEKSIVSPFVVNVFYLWRCYIIRRKKRVFFISLVQDYAGTEPGHSAIGGLEES